MRYSLSQLTHVSRLVLVALPVLLLLGLNGRMVSLLRPTPPAGAQASAAPRATVIKQKVVLEAASPLGCYVAPAGAAWLPPTPLGSWQPRQRRAGARALATGGAPAAFVAQGCRQRLLRRALSPQAP